MSRGAGRGNVTIDNAEELSAIQNQIANAVGSLRSAVGSAADLRVTLLSGVVTTVTTVTGLTNIGSQPANLVVANLSNMVAIASNLNNIST